VVENFDVLCVTRLISGIPANSQVFSRAPLSGLRLSRLEISYPLDSLVWRWRLAILSIAWLLLPLVVSFFIAHPLSTSK
jgi:hypothetical protein